jgi:hypothetical protein
MVEGKVIAGSDVDAPCFGKGCPDVRQEVRHCCHMLHGGNDRTRFKLTSAVSPAHKVTIIYIIPGKPQAITVITSEFSVQDVGGLAVPAYAVDLACGPTHGVRENFLLIMYAQQYFYHNVIVGQLI